MTKLGFSLPSCLKIEISKLYYGTSLGTLLFDATTMNLSTVLNNQFVMLDTNSKQLKIIPNQANSLF